MTRHDPTGQDRTGQDRTGQDPKGQERTKLTFKLDFPGNLCEAVFAILAMFIFNKNSCDICTNKNESVFYWCPHSY